MRLNGFSEIKRNDIVVFTRNDRDAYFVKRCLGLPGERFEIKNTEIFINNRTIKPLPDVKQLYKIDVGKFISVADNLNIDYNLSNFDKSKRFAETTLTTRNIDQLIETGNRSCFLPLLTDTGNVYLHQFFRWSPINFGTILIPAKNMRIKLADTNFKLYRDIFYSYEKSFIYRSADGFYLQNGRLVTYYTFKHNYYFMLGDNRNNSADSRYWGFLPETHIEGKVLRVLFSLSNDNFLWGRFLSPI